MGRGLDISTFFLIFILIAVKFERLNNYFTQRRKDAENLFSQKAQKDSEDIVF